MVDSPLIASRYLKLWQYRQHGVQFNLWFSGVHNLNKHKVIKAFKAFSGEQIRTMGDFPEKQFHFMFHTPETKVYHGVEHASSTVIALGPASELHKSRYADFLGVSSHELFHCWNVLKIRPRELMPYDFSREVYFDTGFVAEGVTTYYGDLFLVRSGVYDQTQYFKELNKLCKRHFENEGRHHASLVDSSRDLWVDGYQQGAPNRKVSIYTKGALVSLMLDLIIRQETNHHASLDRVMQMLWKEFGGKSKGYSMHDFRSTCEQVAGKSLNAYFDNFIYGTLPLEYELANLLEVVGCCLKAIPSKQLSKKLFGFKTSIKEGSLVVSKIAEASPAHRKLSLEDELISVNGKKPKHRLNGLIKGDYRLRLEVLSNGRKRKVTLTSKNQQFFMQLQISKMKQVSDQQKRAFNRWLGVEF